MKIIGCAKFERRNLKKLLSSCQNVDKKDFFVALGNFLGFSLSNFAHPIAFFKNYYFTVITDTGDRCVGLGRKNRS